MLLLEARALLGRGVLMHASAVAFGDRCWLFLARSGGGKTTIAFLLEKAGGTAVGSDTAIVCRGTDSVIRAMSCGSFAPAREGRPPATRLEKLVFLEKGPLAGPIPLDPSYAGFRIRRQGQLMILDSLTPPEREATSLCMKEILAECGCVILRFDLGDPPEAVRRALSGEG
jgi:hypothetical protein